MESLNSYFFGKQPPEEMQLIYLKNVTQNEIFKWIKFCPLRSAETQAVIIPTGPRETSVRKVNLIEL